LIKDPALNEKYRQDGLEFVKKYDLERNIDQFIDVYQTLTAGKRAGAGLEGSSAGHRATVSEAK